MRTTPLLLALCFTAPWSLSAADSAILIIQGSDANDPATATPRRTNRAIIKDGAGGQFTVRADDFKWEDREHVLICVGAVSIEMGGRVVTGKDLRIQMAAGDKPSLYMLNPDGIKIGADPSTQSSGAFAMPPPPNSARPPEDRR